MIKASKCSLSWIMNSVSWYLKNLNDFFFERISNCCRCIEWNFTTINHRVAQNAERLKNVKIHETLLQINFWSYIIETSSEWKRQSNSLSVYFFLSEFTFLLLRAKRFPFTLFWMALFLIFCKYPMKVVYT